MAIVKLTLNILTFLLVYTSCEPLHAKDEILPSNKLDNYSIEPISKASRQPIDSGIAQQSSTNPKQHNELTEKIEGVLSFFKNKPITVESIEKEFDVDLQLKRKTSVPVTRYAPHSVTYLYASAQKTIPPGIWCKTDDSNQGYAPKLILQHTEYPDLKKNSISLTLNIKQGTGRKNIDAEISVLMETNNYKVKMSGAHHIEPTKQWVKQVDGIEHMFQYLSTSQDCIAISYSKYDY